MVWNLHSSSHTLGEFVNSFISHLEKQRGLCLTGVYWRGLKSRVHIKQLRVLKATASKMCLIDISLWPIPPWFVKHDQPLKRGRIRSQVLTQDNHSRSFFRDTFLVKLVWVYIFFLSPTFTFILPPPSDRYTDVSGRNIDIPSRFDCI